TQFQHPASFIENVSMTRSKFHYYLLHHANTINTHIHSLNPVALISERSDAHGVRLSEVLKEEDSVWELLDWLKKGEYYDEDRQKTYTFGDTTRAHYYTSLRKFGRMMNDGVLPDSMEVIPTGSASKVSKNAPLPDEVITWEDTVNMIRSCYNWRDKAILAVAWDSGARPFEIEDLTYNRVSRDGEFLQITVGGKGTPLRDVRLTIASPLLKYWLENEHPANSAGERFTSETPIWSHLDKNRPLSRSGLSSIVRRVAARIDIDKPVNLRQFRKSRASVLASREEIDRGDLEERQGWTKGSRIVAVYIVRFGSSTDDKIAKSDGLSEEHLPESDHEEFHDPAPVLCPNCSRFTPRYDSECIWCKKEFNPNAVEEVEHSNVESPSEQKAKEEARSDLVELITNGEITEESVVSAKKLRRVIEDYPELLDHADKLRELVEPSSEDDDGDDDDDSADNDEDDNDEDENDEDDNDEDENDEDDNDDDDEGTSPTSITQ
ncbi:site-specific integrase, partial [Natranaeroarchaeum aerophilus]